MHEWTTKYPPSMESKQHSNGDVLPATVPPAVAYTCKASPQTTSFPFTNAKLCAQRAPVTKEEVVTSDPAVAEEAVALARMRRNCIAGHHSNRRTPRIKEQRSHQPPARHHPICRTLLRSMRRLPHLPYVLPVGGSSWWQDGPQKRLSPPGLCLAAPLACRRVPSTSPCACAKPLHCRLHGGRNPSTMGDAAPSSVEQVMVHRRALCASVTDHGMICREGVLAAWNSRKPPPRHPAPSVITPGGG
jgi:hypothetical protein